MILRETVDRMNTEILDIMTLGNEMKTRARLSIDSNAEFDGEILLSRCSELQRLIHRAEMTVYMGFCEIPRIPTFLVELPNIREEEDEPVDLFSDWVQEPSEEFSE
jgi:hypothetical protein